jgi:hypothetical protein
MSHRGENVTGEPAELVVEELDEEYADIVDALYRRAERNLRVLLYYGPNELNIYYLREDLLEEDLQPRLNEIHRVEKSRSPITGWNCLEDFGDIETVAVVHEDVLVVQFRARENEGLLATVDRDGAAPLGLI